MVPSNTGTIPKTRQVDTQIGLGASTSAGNTPRLPRKNIRGTVSAENTPRPATRAQHKRMGTTVEDPSYLPTTVEHMAHKKLATYKAHSLSRIQTEAEEEAAAAADPFQPAPSPASTSASSQESSTQQYAKFATETEEWEARNSARMASLYKALRTKERLRKSTSKNSAQK